MKRSEHVVKRHALTSLSPLILFIVLLNTAYGSIEKEGLVLPQPLFSEKMIEEQIHYTTQESEQQVRQPRERRTKLLNEQYNKHPNHPTQTIVVSTQTFFPQPRIEQRAGLLSRLNPFKQSHTTNIAYTTNLTVNVTVNNTTTLNTYIPPMRSNIDSRIGELIALHGNHAHQGILNHINRFTIADWTHATPLNSAIATYLYGWSLYKGRQYENAKKQFNELTDLITPAGANSAAYLMLGEIALERKDLAQANTLLKKGLATFDDYSNFMQTMRIEPTPRSTIHNRLAQAFSQVGQPRLAEFEFKNALRYAEGEQRQNIAQEAGLFYAEQGNPEKALEYYQESLKLATELNDVAQMCYLHARLTTTYSTLNQVEEAMKHAEKASKLVAEHPYHHGLSTFAASSLGTAYMTLGKHEEALENYQLAHERAIYHEDKLSQATTLGGLANVHVCTGNFQEAIRCYNEILSTPQTSRTENIALGNRAVSYYQWTFKIIESVYKGSLQNWPAPLPESGIHGIDPQITLMAAYLQNLLTFDHEQTKSLKKAMKNMTLAIEDLNTVIEEYEVRVADLPPTSEFHHSLLQKNQASFETLQNILITLGEPLHALKVADQSRSRRAVETLRRRNEYNEYDIPLKEEDLLKVMALQGSPTIQFSHTNWRLIAWYFNPFKREGDRLQTFSCFMGTENSKDPDTLSELLKKDSETSEEYQSYLEVGLEHMAPQLLIKAKQCLQPLTLALHKDFAHDPYRVINLTGDHTKLLFKIILHSLNNTGESRFSETVLARSYISIAHMASVADQEQAIPFESSLSDKEKSLIKM